MNNKIVGYDNEKRELAQLRDMLHHAEEYRAMGVRIPRGVALYGVPGIGKTVLAKSIADEGINMVELRAADCCVGDESVAIRKVFEQARKKAPCVLLLDELDKIAGTSDFIFMEGNDEVKKILLQEIDALSDAEDILVVATCNDTECLGDALMRPGRFDRLIAMTVPDEPTRKEILKMYFSHLKINKQLDFGRLAKLTGGYTGAQLECLANETGLYAIECSANNITEEDVRAVMMRMSLGSREGNPSLDSDEIRRIAIHEAGHAVVGLVLHPDGILGATVLPQGYSSGHVQIYSSEECPSVSQVEEDVTILLAGRVAEQLVEHEIYLGSEADMKNAAAKILELATVHAAYGYRYLIGSIRHHWDSEAIKDELGFLLDEKLCELAVSAENILREHRLAHERIVAALIGRKSLTREELLDLFAEDQQKAA